MVLDKGVEYHRCAAMPAPDLADLLRRALRPAGATEGDPTEERILDAALDAIAAHGTRRATMHDVAARSGVARITLFRRFGSKDALVERLLIRELLRFLARVDAGLDRLQDPAERVSEAFAACVRAGAEHPLVARLARTEPGAALERLNHGEPSPLEVGRRYVAGRIAADTGRADADEIADVLVRLAATYVLLPGPVLDTGDETAARDFARRVLAPIVGRA